MLPLLACGAGVYMGLYFNILVLLPFSVLGAGAFIVSSWASGQGFLDSASLLWVPFIAIQVGYMLGLTARGTCAPLLARLSVRQSERI